MSKGFGIASLILVVFAFMGFNLVQFPELMDGEASSSYGEILEVKGEALSKTNSQSFFRQASKGQQLFNMQKLLTSFDSQALIDFGTKFWLMPNSYVRLEKVKNKYQIHVLSGRIKKEDNASGDALFFVEGKEQRGEVIAKGAIAQMTSIPLDNIEMETSSNTPISLNSSISEKQIHQTFKLHQRFVEKCFIKHYSRSGGQTQSGKVWIRFMVGKSGKLHQPNIRKSNYTDEEFHSCLLEVVQRVQLKNYSGPQVQVEFPIDIRLPQ